MLIADKKYLRETMHNLLLGVLAYTIAIFYQHMRLFSRPQVEKVHVFISIRQFLLKEYIYYYQLFTLYAMGDEINSAKATSISHLY